MEEVKITKNFLIVATALLFGAIAVYTILGLVVLEDKTLNVERNYLKIQESTNEDTPVFQSEIGSSMTKLPMSIPCGDISEYVRSVTGQCRNSDQENVTHDPTAVASSNFEYKESQSAEVTISFALIENIRTETIERILRYVDLQIVQRGNLQETDYVNSLEQLKQSFPKVEQHWMEHRDALCDIVVSSIPPEAIGTNGIEYLTRIDCLTKVTRLHLDELREIEQWISSSPARG